MSNAESSPTRTSISSRFGSLPTRLLLALFGGSLGYFVFERQGIWPLMFPMLGAIYFAAKDLKFGKAYLVGLVAGFSFFASQTFWLSMYLGPVPLIALSALQALIFAAFFAAGTAVVTRYGEKVSGLRFAVLAASVTSVFWISREWFSGNYPYGGFPWARLVSAHTETSISRWVWLGGMSLADFLIVFATVFALELLRQKTSGGRDKLALIPLMAVFAIPLTFPISATAESGTLKIASVQGNANAGLFSNRESGRIFKNHIAGTEKLLASGQPFDVLVWPENAVDLDLFGNPSNYRDLEALVQKINRPLIFGTVTERDKLYNTSILWLPKKNMTDWYDKTKPVPFAEYVPDRAFWSQVAPDLIGLLNYDFSPGSRDGIFKVGENKLGVLICFEIAVDNVPTDLVNHGAQVILSQTNNSDFGKSDEAYQQLAIAKLRAIETGRSLVNISTVGPSAVYLADGSEVASLPAFTQGFMNTSVPLRNSKTPAMFVVTPLTFGAVTTSILLFGSLLLGRIRGRGRR